MSRLSVQMVQHMILMMVAPMFLALGAHSRREARREDRRLDLLEAQMQRAAVGSGGPATEKKPSRYDQARAGQPAEMRPRAPEVNVETINEQ